ncbi:MAG: hypothetical protein R6V07_04020, partial [Armatimonadota bacterium]
MAQNLDTSKFLEYVFQPVRRYVESRRSRRESTVNGDGLEARHTNGQGTAQDDSWKPVTQAAKGPHAVTRQAVDSYVV